MLKYIPKHIENALDKLEGEGFEAYIVGGAIRDILLDKYPNDFDIATNALPHEIKEVFKGFKTIEVGRKFGTITIMYEESNVEITTFRFDGIYIDGRRPERVYFSKSLYDDMSRRDFTVNSIAYSRSNGIIDYFNGIEDLKNKIIRSVGNPDNRLKEDYLRILRGVRLATQLDFKIDGKTFRSCKKNSKYIKEISIERIRDEVFKILLSKSPSNGMRLMLEIGLLEELIPELIDTIGFDQRNPYHDKDVFEHTLCVLDKVSPILHLRIAALFHDICKPSTFTIDEDGIGHFYGHEKLGALISRKILERWKVSTGLIMKVENLIYKHMVQHTTIKEKGLKRLLSRFGEEEIFRLLELQKMDKSCTNHKASIGDIINSEEIIKKILKNNQAYKKKQLAINGNDVIELGYKQGKVIGEILDYLLDKVMDNPDLNNKEELTKIILNKFK